MRTITIILLIVPLYFFGQQGSSQSISQFEDQDVKYAIEKRGTDSVPLEKAFQATDTLGDQFLLDDMDLLIDEEDSLELQLLPPKMMFTQQLLWGERGLLRRTKVFPLTPEKRNIELKWRRGLLVTHQVIGYATVASMIGTAITGTRLYNGTGGKDIHEAFASGTSIGYIIGGTFALFGPPGLGTGRKSKKWDSIDWHKFFAYGHVAGMITTNVLSGLAGDSPGYRNAHRISGYFTAAMFTAALVSIKF